jgi:hypothetical protein
MRMEDATADGQTDRPDNHSQWARRAPQKNIPRKAVLISASTAATASVQSALAHRRRSSQAQSTHPVFNRCGGLHVVGGSSASTALWLTSRHEQPPGRLPPHASRNTPVNMIVRQRPTATEWKAQKTSGLPVASPRQGTEQHASGQALAATILSCRLPATTQQQ